MRLRKKKQEEEERKKEVGGSCSYLDGPRDYHTEWSKSDRKGKILYDISFKQNLKRNGTNELTSKTETDSQT